MRAKKNFVVVAYDVADNRRRSHVVKILEEVGIRINYSVFECMLTDFQLENLRERIGAQINKREDRIVYYPVCVGCYAKIRYQPDRKTDYARISVV